MLTIFTWILLATIPNTNPQLPQVVYRVTSISATSNTTISDSITIGSPQAVGQSSWIGNFRYSSAIVMTAAVNSNSSPLGIPPAVTVSSASYNGTPGADTYYYWVIASYSNGTLDVVPATSANVGNVGTVDGSTPVTVTWGSPSPGASFKVARKVNDASPPSNGESVQVGTVGVGGNVFVDTGGAASGITIVPPTPQGGRFPGVSNPREIRQGIGK